ncbi:MAG: DUF362 domain-containing protein [Firmicutes bacterium]|nr:DUF362 domain-containing protein [Bacillota bacterium]
MKNRLVIKYGNRPLHMVQVALEAASLADSIDTEARIGIKPNLVLDQPAALGATTHAEVVAGIIEYLNGIGCRQLMIIESSAIGYSTTRAFTICGYDRLAAKYNVELVDLKDDQAVLVRAAGLDLSVCKTAIELDYLINVPVLKAHCQTALTCALKNLKGCIPDREKRRFHTLGLHRPIAALNAALTTNLVVVDGICGDLTFEEGGNPVAMNQIIVGSDPVLVDAYAAEQIGLDPASIRYITLAEQLGLGSADLNAAEIIRLGTQTQPASAAVASPLARQLAKYVDARSACSICYGSLIRALARLQETGQLDQLGGKIKIGQEFRGRQEEGIGIGACTAGLTYNLPGCPPGTKKIVEFLAHRGDIAFGS